MADRADYEAVLADLRAKKQEIEITIAALERLLGVMGGAAVVQTTHFVQGSYGKTTAVLRESRSRDKPYRGLTIKLAAVKYLDEVRLKQTAKQIADALSAGGFTNRSKNFPNTVRTTLAREPEFIKIGNEWALRSWYPSHDASQPTEDKQAAAH